MRKWVIVYSDASTFAHSDGTWAEAPSRDVQAILFQNEAGRWELRHGANMKHGDFFRLDDDGSAVGMDLTGMVDHVVHELGIVKEGRMLAGAHWRSVYNFAKRLCADLNCEAA